MARGFQFVAIHLRGALDRPPIIVSPYDAELFGHWWFEGPDWLECLIRKAHFDQPHVQLISPSDYFRHQPTNQMIQPSMSSWGHGGYHEVWLGGSNDWIYRHLHKMAERMVEVADAHPSADALQTRTLNQMARELLLAQSSDWAFILKTQTHTAYAYRRLHEHIARFNALYDEVKTNRLDASRLSTLEARDNLFSFLDYRVYASS